MKNTKDSEKMGKYWLNFLRGKNPEIKMNIVLDIL